MADPTVADLLAQSHRAHWLYHQHLPRMAAGHGGQVSATPGDTTAALGYLQQAADARTQADLLDPAHVDPSWSDEAAQFPHEELTRFYAEQIDKNAERMQRVDAIEIQEKPVVAEPPVVISNAL